MTRFATCVSLLALLPSGSAKCGQDGWIGDSSEECPVKGAALIQAATIVASSVNPKELVALTDEHDANHNAADWLLSPSPSTTTPTTTTPSLDSKPEATENVVVLAELAQNVYGLHSSNDLTLPAESLAAQKGYVIEKKYAQPDFGTAMPKAAMAVYARNDSHGRFAVLAIKGTDPGSATDIKHDIESLVGGKYPKAAIDAAALVLEEFRGKYGHGRVLVTGHSLGGYLGEIISTTYNVPGTVFCAPGPDSLHNKHNGDHMHTSFHNINAHHDALGNINIALWSHKQWSIFVEGNDAHDILTMISELTKVPKVTEIDNKNVIDYTSSGSTGYWLSPTK